MQSYKPSSPSISTGTWRLGLIRSTSGCLGSYRSFVSKGTICSSNARPGAPTDDELHALLHTVITRLMKMLTRHDVLIEEMGQIYLATPTLMGTKRAPCGHCRRRPSLTASPSGRAPGTRY